MTITLTNTQRNITLDRILEYNIHKETRTGVKKIPGKATPTIDHDTRVTSPRAYRLRARVSDTDKTTLLSMESDREVITLNNGSITDQDCEMEMLDFDAEPGHLFPYIARIQLLSSAN